jgi:hypothetical protein
VFFRAMAASSLLSATIIYDVQRRRKQTHLREQLGKWRAEEELNKELVGAASAKLQRPKSVDPGEW